MSLDTTAFPWRKVTHRVDTTTRYNRFGEGSRWHYLDCGHRNTTKQSYGLPKRMRCRDCYYNRPKLKPNDDPQTL